MERFARLIQKAERDGNRLQITYVPEEEGEEWCVKFYPDPEESDYFYAYHCDLEMAATKLLDELREQNL